MKRQLRLACSVTAVLALLAAPSSPAVATPDEPRPPADYTAIEGLSQPAHETRRDVYRVPMRDGIEMYVEVERPVSEGRFPVILHLGPYHGTAEDRDGTHILPWPEEDGEALGLAGYFAPRGYAVAFADLRGTGRSQGCLDYLGPKDRADAYDVVEWLAARPWSTGRVGMTGHSYPAMASLVAAASHPPHLVTVAPSAGSPRMYDHLFQDGVPYIGSWLGPLAAYELIAAQRHLPPTPLSIPIFGTTGDNFGNDMEYAGCGATQSAGMSGAAYVTGAEVDWHRERDHTAGLVSADIPVFYAQGMHDGAVRPVTMSWLAGRRNAGDKLWFGQWHHGSTDFPYPNDRFEQWTGALHAWFDRHLQERDVDTGPPVELFLNDDSVVTAKAWPPPPSAVLRLFPSPGHVLAPSPGAPTTASYVAEPSSASSRYTPSAEAPGFWPQQLEFHSAPMERDVLIAGTPALRLTAAISSPRVDLMATLWDVGPDGEGTRPIGRAGFAINPELREGIDRPKPVTPGEVMELRPTGPAEAYLLRAGRRLALVVSSSETDKTPLFAAGAQVTLSLGGTNGTVLDVPVIEDPTRWPDPLDG